MLPLLFVGIVLTCSDLLLGQASVQVLPNITVTITPAKATLRTFFNCSSARCKRKAARTTGRH